MDRLIYTAMTGAKHTFLQQAGVAQNLANASTNGYRSEEHRFRAVPLQGDGLPTRAFVVDASVKNVFDQGPMMFTGNSLDSAIQGKGWFAVLDANGQEAYTRAGSFVVNANGQLQTKTGLTVMGDGGPLAIPQDSNSEIGADGTISVVQNYGIPNTSNIIGRLKLVNPPEDQLVRGDDGLFRQASGQPAPFDANIQVAPQTVEGSNVNVVDTMVSLISLSRQFEMQMEMLKKADTNAQAADQVLTVA